MIENRSGKGLTVAIAILPGSRVAGLVVTYHSRASERRQPAALTTWDR